MSTKTDIQPACARLLGKTIRQTLKQLGLNWKVSCKTVSFSGFGYGAAPFAEIQTERLLTDDEKKALADAIRRVREIPDEVGGGKGIVQLAGTSYAFGGSIGYKDFI